ncbi:MAG: ABC-2 family transporter protein [Eubacteriales bacterium]|nr:ABC-2 family transporter protein [Eubacteriales bacterium]
MNKYKTAFLVGVSNSMEFRFDFFMNLLSTVFPIIMQVFIWISMYGGNGGDAMYGYTFPQMILYVVVAGAVSKFTNTGVEYLVNEDIHSGGIAKYLVRPVNYIGFRLCDTIGNKLASMITMVILTLLALLVLFFAVDFVVVPAAVLLFFPSLILAAVLNFFLFFCLSTMAFWLTEIGNFFHAMSVVIMVMSGGVFPVSVFGHTYERISRFIPLSYTINYPIQILSGVVSTGEAVEVLGIQLVWIFLLAALARLGWHRGLQKYVAVGG